MSEKLYLIRINLESYLGPMLLRDVRTSYKKMLFGLQDEIAGSNNQWVAFDDLEKMERVYPELVETVRKEMLAGWAISEPTALKLSSSRKSRGKDPFKTIFLPLIISLIICLIGMVLIFSLKNGGASRTFLAKKDPYVERVTEFLATGKRVQAEAYIDRYQKQIVKSRNIREWLPYLRMVAYSRDGQFEGLKSSLLRSGQSWTAPLDCSQASWKTRWERSRGEWTDFFEGKDIPKKEWSKILLWDPFWILRRSQLTDWIEPSSYYEACLRMSIQGLQALEIAPTDTVLDEQRKTLLSRLQWMLSILKGTPLQGEFQMSGVMWALSCIESSEEKNSGNECVASNEWSEDWSKILKARLNWRQTSILLMNKKIIKNPQFDEFRQGVERLVPLDPMTGFDYQPEMRFYQQIIITGGNIAAAIEEMKGRLSGYSFDEYP
jgi:hypothetical protein